MKTRDKKLDKKTINLLSQNICTIPECNCGANIELGFFTKEDFEDFMQLLKKHYNITKLKGVERKHKNKR